MADIQSRPYFHGDACEACTFARGAHASHCVLPRVVSPSECKHVFPHHGWGPTGPCIHCGLTHEQVHELELHRLADDGCPHA